MGAAGVDRFCIVIAMGLVRLSSGGIGSGIHETINDGKNRKLLTVTVTGGVQSKEDQP